MESSPPPLRSPTYHEALVRYLKTHEAETWAWFASSKSLAEHTGAPRLQLLKQTWFRTDPIRAHLRQYFPDFEFAATAPSSASADLDADPDFTRPMPERRLASGPMARRQVARVSKPSPAPRSAPPRPA